MKHPKWKTIVALIPLILAIVLRWWWFFSLLFVAQIIFSLMVGSVTYVEEVKKSEYPVLFWAIMGIWTFLAIYALAIYLV